MLKGDEILGIVYHRI